MDFIAPSITAIRTSSGQIMHTTQITIGPWNLTTSNVYVMDPPMDPKKIVAMWATIIDDSETNPWVLSQNSPNTNEDYCGYDTPYLYVAAYQALSGSLNHVREDMNRGFLTVMYLE